jgi:hypothetical protein
MQEEKNVVLCFHVRSPGAVRGFSKKESAAIQLMALACVQQLPKKNVGLGMEVEIKEETPITELKINRQELVDMEDHSVDFDLLHSPSVGGLFVCGQHHTSDVMSEEQKQACLAKCIGVLIVNQSPVSEHQSESFNILVVPKHQVETYRKMLQYV